MANFIFTDFIKSKNKKEIIMINKIDSTSFQSRFHMNGFSKHTPKMRPYEELHFMPELQTQNPIRKFFKNTVEYFKVLFK